MRERHIKKINEKKLIKFWQKKKQHETQRMIILDTIHENHLMAAWMQNPIFIEFYTLISLHLPRISVHWILDNVRWLLIMYADFGWIGLAFFCQKVFFISCYNLPRYRSDWYSNIKFVNFSYVSSHLHELAMVKLLVVEK